jgi:peptidoglycan/LPS O-acetylase OafA/YrhL
MNTVASKLRGYVPELDGVRGLAIAGVMALHFFGEITGRSTLERAVVKASGYGLWGVDLFFVLSGFLITGILIDAKGQPGYYRNFYARRLLRIFPLYYLVLFLLFVVLPAGFAARFDPAFEQTRAAQGWVWPYLTNYYLGSETSFSIPYVSHFWSLAVEEHFYLLWPIVILLLRREAAFTACLVISLAALGLRVAFSTLAPNLLYASVLTPCRLDSLCIGAAFALAARGAAPPSPARVVRWLGVAAAAVVGVSLWHVVSQSADSLLLPLRTTLLAVVFGCFIYAAAIGEGLGFVRPVLRTASLRNLGKYSYGLYVFHGLVSYAIHQHSPEARLTAALGSHIAAAGLQIAAGVGVSYLLAVLSYELWEKRFLKLKDRFTYGKPAQQVAPRVPNSILAS